MSRVPALLVMAAIALFSARTHAQSKPGFAVNRFEPAERGSRWFVADSLDLRGHVRPALGATLDYSHKPLVTYDRTGRERFALVRDQIFVHLGGGVVIAHRFRFGVNLPVAIHQDGEPARVLGEQLGASTKPAIGDLRVAADARLLGETGEVFTLAAGVRAWLPTGPRSQFVGDGAARLSPQILAAGDIGFFSWAARAAFVYRARDEDYGGESLGSELTFAAGAGARIGPVRVGPEIFGSTQPGAPVEALIGAHLRHSSGFEVALAIGSGLTQGYGSPALRMLASLAWGMPTVAEKAAISDRDHDEIADPLDACPDWPGPPSPEPETNGCPPEERVPDEDIDGDGVFDREDACPGVPGVRTSDPMTTGCPAGAERQLAIVTKTSIRIGEEISFATDSADLLEGSEPILTAVRGVLEAHPEIRLVRVEGHTDDTGSAAHNEDLSRRRAAAVVRWLVTSGIRADRLVSEGFGSRKPLDATGSVESRAKNRRVAFVIVEKR